MDILQIQPEEIDLLTPPAADNMVQWAVDNFKLPAKTSELSGNWSPEYTPYLVRPMQLLSSPPCEVWINACTQSGKTTLLTIDLGYTVDVRPGPMSITMPDQAAAERRVNTRYRSMFEENPRLLKHLKGNSKNLLIGKETILDNMILYLTWAGSASALSDNPIRHVRLDEVGKMKLINSTGENPIDLIRNRQKTFRLTKTLCGVSSPQEEGDIFDAEIKSGTDEQWYVPCCRCGGWHLISIEHFIIDKESDGTFFDPRLYEDGDRCRYVCPVCKKPWAEIDRALSNSSGQWVPKGCELSVDGKLIGTLPPGNKYSFTVHCFMVHPRFQTMADVAAQWVAAQNELKRGNKAKLIDVKRNLLAQSTSEVAKTVNEELIRIKRGKFLSGQVPPDVRILVAGADYHVDQMGNERVDWIVTGFADDLVNYDIAFGHAVSLEDMARQTTHASFSWAAETGKHELMLACGFIDTGYQPNADNPDDQTPTDIVYQFCRRYSSIWIPIKGGPASQAGYFHEEDLDKVVATAANKYRKRYSGIYRGMRLITINVNMFKDIVMDWAEKPAGQPGCTHYYDLMPEEYFEQLTNEHKKLIKGGGRSYWGWAPKYPGAKTHGLDVKVYSTAAGYWLKAWSFYSEQTRQSIQESLRSRRPLQTPIRRRQQSEHEGFLDRLPEL